VNNHCFDGQTVPALSVGTTIGGNDGSLFADAASGNFTPTALLAANAKPPVVRYDRQRKDRETSCPPGAIAANAA